MRVHDNWKWKHLVLNGNSSCVTFHLLFYGQCPNHFDLGLEWNVLQSLVVKVDSTQMHLFDEHGASPIHSEFELLFLGPYKVPFVFPPPLFERLSFGIECVPRGR